MRVTRTHDALYLKENSYNKTREIFKFAYRLVKKNSHNKKIIGDFGCAAGEFLFFLRNKFNFNYKLIGFDINNLLLKKARKKVKNVDFIKQDLLKKNKKYKNFSYISTCIGVMTIFDDFYKVINNLIYYTKKKVEGGGTIILHFLANDFDLDVNIKCASSVFSKKNKNNNFYEAAGTIKQQIFLSSRNKFLTHNRVWQAGWNILSKSTIKSYLECHHQVKKFSFYDFKINRKIKQQKDPLRSWTAKYGNNFEIINGLGLIQRHCFVVIEL